MPNRLLPSRIVVMLQEQKAQGWIRRIRLCLKSMVSRRARARKLEDGISVRLLPPSPKRLTKGTLFNWSWATFWSSSEQKLSSRRFKLEISLNRLLIWPIWSRGFPSNSSSSRLAGPRKKLDGSSLKLLYAIAKCFRRLRNMNEPEGRTVIRLWAKKGPIRRDQILQILTQAQFFQSAQSFEWVDLNAVDLIVAEVELF